MNQILTSRDSCKICGGNDWSVLYYGRIRIGKFGELTDEPRTIFKCNKCEVGFLEISQIDYESGKYREIVDGSDSIEHFYKTHDIEQLEKINIVGTGDLRNRIIMDIGCGAGSFLDLVKGYSSKTIGIEPQKNFHAELLAKGHYVYSYCEEISEEWVGKVDLAVCFSVIEHLDDPKGILQQIRRLLKSNGILLISTPNLNDWLLELLPDDYPSFFYRVVHKWYFSGSAIEYLAREANFSKVFIKYIHRFDLSNFLLWLRDKKPTGFGRLTISPSLNAHFCRDLEEKGRADYIYAWLQP